MTWEIDKSKTQSHWLEVTETEFADVTYRAHAKWDGCVQYSRFFNGGEDEDSIHFCDLDDEILRLQRLREAAKKHFGEGWPKL